MASLPTAHFVALRPLFLIRQAHFVQIFPLKLTHFCKLSAGLRSTSKSANFLLFHFSFLSTLLHYSLLRLSFCFTLSGTSARNFLLFLHRLLGSNWSEAILWEMTRSKSWPGVVRCSSHPLSHVISFSLFFSFLFFCIYSFLPSDWVRAVFSKIFDTQVFSVSTDELVLSHHTHCVLFRFCCNEQSFPINSQLFRIGRVEYLSCNACSHPTQNPSHFILHCPDMNSLGPSLFDNFFSFYDLWS